MPETPKQSVKKPGPDEALALLKAGNFRFCCSQTLHPDADKARLKLAASQDQADYAYATVLTCSDSRVPVELIFDAGVMDVFVIRIAGNVCDTDVIGSIEYGLAHVKTPLLVVMGHTKCGAVTTVVHALHGEKQHLERNILPLIGPIIPAVKHAMAAHPEARGDDLIPLAIEQNVWQGIANLFLKSPATRDLIKAGQVKVVGAIYDLGTDQVTWLDPARVTAILTRVEASPNKEREPFAE